MSTADTIYVNGVTRNLQSSEVNGNVVTISGITGSAVYFNTGSRNIPDSEADYQFKFEADADGSGTNYSSTTKFFTMKAQ